MRYSLPSTWSRLVQSFLSSAQLVGAISIVAGKW
jgi:hypothetical protein